MELSIPPSCGRIATLAQRHPRRAARLAERALHHTRAETITYAWARYTYGWALLCWERIDAARAQLLVALEHFGSHQAGALRCRYALLLADQLQLARPQLDRDFAEMSMQYMALGAPLESARISIEHARHLTVLGNPRAAEILLDQAAPALAGGTPIDLARLDRIRGVAANARTDFPRAAALLTRAEQVFLAQRHPIDAAKCWLEQAWLALRQEQLDVAEAGYARAERVFLAHDLPLQQAFCAKNMSLLMAKRGAYNQAMQASLRALAAFIALGRAGDIGACQLHLGNIHFYTAGWDAALARYLRAEAIYSDLGMHGYCLLAQRNRAMVYRAQGRHAEARALLTIVEAQARQLDAMLEVAEVRSLEAAILAESGAWEQAAQRFGAARALFAQHQNHHGVAECDLELGWIALAQGQTALAHALFQAAAPATRQHPHDRWRVDYGLARCAELSGDVDTALASYQSAIETVGALRQKLVSETTSSSVFAQAAQMHVDGLRLALGQGAYATALALAECQRALILQHARMRRPAAVPAELQDELITLREHLGARLERAGDADLLDATLAAYSEALLRARHNHGNEPLPDARIAPALDLAALRRQLNTRYGNDWTVVIYVWIDDQLWIGELTSGTLNFSATHNDLALQDLLEQASHPAYRNYTYDDFAYLQGACATPWQRLRELTERLLPERVRRRLHSRHRLLIIPSGVLHMLPWAALRLAHGWLIEQTMIQVIPSLAIWHVLAMQQPKADATALFIGCQTFGTRAPVLAGVAAEQRLVAQTWPALDVLRDQQASCAALLERSRQGRLRTYRVIHIASHAQLIPAYGLLAHLKLADADLLLDEIAQLDLDGCLVVLSACDGAAADVLPGEEILSLSWAFLAAGARSVLASLWPLDDQAVAALIERFYAALHTHGDAVAALAEAQRALLAGKAAPALIAHRPLHWGSFVIVGAGN